MTIKTALYLLPEIHEEIRWRVFDGRANSQTQEINAILLGLRDPLDLDKLKGQWPDKWTDCENPQPPANKPVFTHVYLIPELHGALTQDTYHTGINRKIHEIITGRSEPMVHLQDKWDSKWKKPRRNA